jgi:O-antigen/teichoic acid export membrane protein
MGSGLRDVSVTFGSRIAMLVLGLGLQSCLAWFLGPAGRGEYAVCLIYMTVLSISCTFGVDAAAQYLVASKEFSVSEAVSVLLFLEIIGAVLATVGGLAAVYLPLEFFAKASTTSFFIAVLSAPWQMWTASLLLILASTRDFSFQAGAVVVQALLRFVGTVLLVKVAGLAVNGAVAANLLAFAITTFLTLSFLRRRHHLHWVRPAWKRIRRTLGYGGRYYFAAFGTLVNVQIGVIMMAFFASADDIGLFHAASSLILFVVVISDTVGAVIHPRIAADPRGRPELAAQSVRLVGMVCGCIVLLLAAFARPIIAVLLSPQFLPAVPVIWILAPAVIYRAGTKVLVHYFNATDHPGIFSASTITGMVFNFVLLLILLPRMGLQGAAWAMSIAYFCGGTVLAAAFWRLSGLTFAASFLPQRADLTFVLDLGRRVLRLPLAGRGWAGHLAANLRSPGRENWKGPSESS